MKSVVVLVFVSVVCSAISIELCSALENEDMAALWLFDENSGDVVKDASGSGNDGKIVGAKWTAGKFGTALPFAGDNTYVEVPDSESLSIQGDQITVQAWVNPREIHQRDTSLNAVAQKWGDGSNRRQYQLTLSAGGGGTAWFYVSTDGVNFPRVEGVTPIELGKWTHIAGTYDGSHLRIYVNGVLDAELAQSGDLHSSDIYVRLGGYGMDAEYGQNRFLDGAIDEVMIAKKALTASEIQASMGSLASVYPDLKATTAWGWIKSHL